MAWRSLHHHYESYRPQGMPLKGKLFNADAVYFLFNLHMKCTGISHLREGACLMCAAEAEAIHSSHASPAPERQEHPPDIKLRSNVKDRGNRTACIVNTSASTAIAPAAFAELEPLLMLFGTTRTVRTLLNSVHSIHWLQNSERCYDEKELEIFILKSLHLPDRCTRVIIYNNDALDIA